MALDTSRSDRGSDRSLQTARLRGRAAGICTAFALGLISGAEPANALSCAPHSLADTLHTVATSPDGYIAVHGTLTFDPAALPVTDWDNQQATPDLTRVPARISGTSLTRSGFSASFDRAITLEVQCFGPWCASAPSGNDTLAFLKQTQAGLTLTLTPCGSDLVFEPNSAMLDQTRRCYLAEHCPKPEY